MEDNNKDIWDFMNGNDKDRHSSDWENNDFKVFLAKKTNNDYLRELREICNRKNIEILSKNYEDARSPLDLKCRVCEHKWSVTPKRMKDTYIECKSLLELYKSRSKSKPKTKSKTNEDNRVKNIKCSKLPKMPKYLIEWWERDIKTDDENHIEVIKSYLISYSKR